jgi:hypothetical protein
MTNLTWRTGEFTITKVVETEGRREIARPQWSREALDEDEE